MTPFSAWAKARKKHDTSVESTQLGEDGADPAAAYQALLDALIDNLSTASAAQLNTMLDTMGKTWAEQQAGRLTERLAAQFAVVEQRVSDALTEALRPVMSEVHLTRTMDEFASMLRKLLPEFAGENLTVAAPLPLQVKLSRKLANEKIEAELVDTDEDILAATGASVSIRAELGSWNELRLRAHAT